MYDEMGKSILTTYTSGYNCVNYYKRCSLICMSTQMPKSSCPFLGPNLYVSTGGGFTTLHQDGHGTVDSGHCNVSGYNEVIMLRRMPECYKRLAVKLVPSQNSAVAMQRFDPLYSHPHDDSGTLPDWPHVTTVDEWKRLKYVFLCILSCMLCNC